MRVVQDDDNIDEWAIFRFDDDETVAKNGRQLHWIAIGVPNPPKKYRWKSIDEAKGRQYTWTPIRNGGEVESEVKDEVEKR